MPQVISDAAIRQTAEEITQENTVFREAFRDIDIPDVGFGGAWHRGLRSAGSGAGSRPLRVGRYPTTRTAACGWVASHPFSVKIWSFCDRVSKSASWSVETGVHVPS